MCIFIADSAKFKVPKDKYFNKRHKNSNKIFLTFYIYQYHSKTYTKIRVPFHAIFKDSSQKPHPHILKLLNIKQDNPYNK